MKNMSQFQIIFMAVFVVLAIAGVGIFSAYKGGNRTQVISIKVWGTLPRSQVDSFIKTAIPSSNTSPKVAYVQKSKENIGQDLLSALALGGAPDAVLMSQDIVLKESKKLTLIPYTSYSESLYKSTYVAQSELYLTGNGILAVPFTVDPMVMYWNRDIFTNNNISEPPKYWEEFITLVPKLTKRDAAKNIQQSAVGMGEYRNVSHAKELLSLLILQAGNPITTLDRNGNFTPMLSKNMNRSVSPTDSALTFFTQFANPINVVYTWNRSMPDSKTMFLSGKLAVYFGTASELSELRAKNPNLNFDVALVPQSKPSASFEPNKITYGNMYGFSLVKGGKATAADVLSVIFTLTNKDSAKAWSQVSGLPSVRRDSTSSDPSKSESAVFATSALWSRGWLDPDTNGTNAAFRNMVENVTSGRLSNGESISQTDQYIGSLIDSL